MEQALLNVAQIFTGEINKLNAKLQGADLKIALQISTDRYNDGKPSVKLEAYFWDGGAHQQIKAASLGALMDEVYRRAGFADREAIRLDQVEASLVALPAPDPVELNDYGKPIDNEPF